jgi:peptidoglycan/LPS O-acetylase OafA/YrhL
VSADERVDGGLRSTSPLPYQPHIDGLRAVAVLSVVAYHAFPTRIRGGFVGVDVFFVISGFLISGIILKGLASDTFSFADFYARRIRRIFPALLVVLAACMAFGWVALLPDEYAQLGKHATAGAAFASNLVLWQEAGYFDTAIERKPLLHLWSLGIEEQFYIIWPLVLTLLYRGGRLVMIVAALALASFAANVAILRADQAAAFYLPVTRFWELLSGCLLAYFAQRFVPNRWTSEALSAAGLALIIASIAVVSSDRAFPGWWALLPVLGATMVIAAGQHATLNRWILANPMAVWIGLISYPLYLWHWPILAFLKIVQPSDVGGWELRLLKVCAIAVAILLSWATYVIIERRLRYGRTHIQLFIGSMTAAACGVVIVINAGFSSRSDFDRDPFLWTDARLRTTRCETQYPLVIERETFCISASPSAQRVDALIGDSHANALFPAFEAAALRAGRGAVHFGEARCFPANGVVTYRDSPSEDRCIRTMASAFKIAAEDPRIERVFIAANWTTYFSVPSSGSTFHMRMGEIETPNEIFQKGLGGTLDMLKGKKVYFVHEVPELGFNPRECLRLRPIDAVRTLRKECAVRRDVVAARQAGYRATVAELLSKRPAVKALDPVPYLCGKTACDVFSGSAVLYRDEGHLGAEAAALLVPMFTEN